MKNNFFILGLVVCFCLVFTSAVSAVEPNSDDSETSIFTKYGTSSPEKVEEVKKILRLVKDFNKGAQFRDICTLMEALRSVYTDIHIKKIPIIKKTGG